MKTGLPEHAESPPFLFQNEEFAAKVDVCRVEENKNTYLGGDNDCECVIGHDEKKSRHRDFEVLTGKMKK